MQVADYQTENFYKPNLFTVTGKELKELRKKTGVSQHALAYATGIPAGTIGRWESEDLEITKLGSIKKIEAFFKNEEKGTQNEENSSRSISGSLRSPPKSNAIEIGELTDDDDSSPFIDIGGGQYIMVVPLVPIKAQAGYIQNYNDEQYIAENFTQKHSFAVSRVYRGKYMAFIVDGDSMDNGVAGEAIPEGYTVTGREIQKQHWRNKFHIHRYKDYIIVHQDGIFIKQISKHDTEQGVITCHSLNPNKDIYADFDLNLDECYQIFNVVNVTQTK